MTHAEKMQAYSQKVMESYSLLLNGEIEASNNTFSEIKSIWLDLISDDCDLV